MSIILERETEDYWPEFGEAFMNGLKIAMIGFEIISVFILVILGLVLLAFGGIRIVGWIYALYEQWDNRKQPKRQSKRRPKQGNDEEVMMGTIVSVANERNVVEEGFLAHDNPRGGG